MKCVICDEEAITTAAHIPVCKQHDDEYQAEASQYPTDRPVLRKLREAHSIREAEIAAYLTELGLSATMREFHMTMFEALRYKDNLDEQTGQVRSQ